MNNTIVVIIIGGRRRRGRPLFRVSGLLILVTAILILARIVITITIT